MKLRKKEKKEKEIKEKNHDPRNQQGEMWANKKWTRQTLREKEKNLQVQEQ
jgi:hypothetical protein